MLMDQVDILHVARYWSEVLRSTRNFVFKFLVKVFVSLYLLTILMD